MSELYEQITFYESVQVLTGRPCSGDPVGWAMTDFCSAISKITGDKSPEVLQGYAGPINLNGEAAKVILSDNFPDLAGAVNDELKPNLTGKKGQEAVQIIETWCANNVNRFFETLTV